MDLAEINNRIEELNKELSLLEGEKAEYEDRIRSIKEDINGVLAEIEQLEILRDRRLLERQSDI